MTVLPWLARLLSISTTLVAMKLSRPEVGSSQNKMAGLVRTSEARDNLFICPPEMPLTPWSGLPIIVSAHFNSPNCEKKEN